MDDTADDIVRLGLTGASKWAGQITAVVPVIAASLWAVNFQNLFGLLIFNEQFLAVMLAFALAACFINVRAAKSIKKDRVLWYDWILAALSLVACGYVIVNYSLIVHDSSTVNPERVAFAVLAIGLVFEATRRMIGWTLILVALFFILYARFGDLMPGDFAVPASNWSRIGVYAFLDTSGLFGLPLAVAGETIVTFILFGAVLKAVKGDRFITDLAMVAMGRYRGGAAKVSIVASTLFGMISGSAVSNVAVVGPISIPMMEKAGYPNHQAAAIEAVSSTGGQIMPPVMGITAFLMADFLAIPYSAVVMAAVLPAILYYVAVFIQVDLEAGKRGLKGLAVSDLPKLVATLAKGYAFIIPLVVLIYTIMIANWSPGKAGLAAAAAALAVGLVAARTRPGLAGLWDAILSTGLTAMNIIILTAVAGIVIGALQLAGLGFSMSSILLALAGNNVFLILVMTSIACTILGMALPTAVIYTMLAVLVAPALVQLGIDRVAAHLFIFYVGMLSMITPPVCFATFTAAAIARADFWKTAMAGMQYGIAAFILPFVFPFSPGLLMNGGPTQVTVSFVAAALGLFGLAAALVGFLFRPLNPAFRILMFVFGCAVMVGPYANAQMFVATVVGLTGGALIVVYEWFASRKLPVAAQSSLQVGK